MSSVLPTFVKGGSEGVKPTLTNEDKYKKLPSGFLFEDIFPGISGPKIKAANLKVTICYQYFNQNTKLIRTGHFNDILTEFADAFDFKADIADAVLGMKMTGYRRIVIPPEMNESSEEYRVVDVLLQSINGEATSEETTERVERKKIAEQKPTAGPEPETSSNYDKDKIAGYSLATIGSIVATLGGGPMILQMIRELKSTLPKSEVTETVLLRRLDDQQIVNPQPKPNQWAGVSPKITYKLINEGEGEVITRYQQGRFQYKEAGSEETVCFEGSPAGLAVKLCPGFEEAMLKAIQGMKLNGRRMIFIPVEVSGLGEDTFLDLTLTAITRDFNPRSRY